MIEDLLTEENVWDRLRREGKPLVLYGMGDGAEKINAVLESKGMHISAVFASDDFVRGQSFLGHKVQRYQEVCQQFKDFIVVLGFASQRPEVLENIARINREHPVYAPDIPVAGVGLFTREYADAHRAEMESVYAKLADEESRRVYECVLRYKISGKVDYLYKSFANIDEIFTDILQVNQQEFLVDMGAYNGDTIRQFLQYSGGKYRSIYALEPDEKNFKKLRRATEGMQGIHLYNKGAWDRQTTLHFDARAGRSSRLSPTGTSVEATDLDSLLQGAPITLLKMDIEGSESEALAGAARTIRTWRPKLYVCAYHRNEDLFALPQQILHICPDYKLYFRHSPYIPAWESNFYCIPTYLSDTDH